MGADSDHQHTKPTEEETFCSHSTSSPEQGMIMQPSEPAGMLYFIQYGFMWGGGGGGGLIRFEWFVCVMRCVRLMKKLLLN